MDRVPAALARAHQHRITHNAPIARARVSADGVTLETVNGATHAAPWVIVCLPAKPLRALEIEGADTAALRRRLAALHTEDEVKVHLLVPGSAFGATAAASTVFRERFPRVTWPSPGRTLDGTRAINMMAVHDEVPPVQKQLARGKKSVRAWLANRMPRVATASTDVFWHDFAADPLAGGAWAWTPGDGGRPAGLPEQLGRLIIAGGDFSTLPGWMEGALQSAEDAVNLLKT